MLLVERQERQPTCKEYFCSNPQRFSVGPDVTHGDRRTIGWLNKNCTCVFNGKVNFIKSDIGTHEIQWIYCGLIIYHIICMIVISFSDLTLLVG